MRRSFSISLLILYMAILIRPVAPYLLFEANSGYIASQLCLQRESKTNKCNGQCFLMKKLKENSEEKDSNTPIQSVEEERTFWQVEEVLEFPTYVTKLNFNPHLYNEGAQDQYASELIVPPPQAALARYFS